MRLDSLRADINVEVLLDVLAQLVDVLLVLCIGLASFVGLEQALRLFDQGVNSKASLAFRLISAFGPAQGVIDREMR